MADELLRHRITVSCPECGIEQHEPALVVSTQCRSCRANFQVRDGKGVVRSRPTILIAKPRKEGDPEPAAAPEPPKLAFNREPSPPPVRSLLKRWFNPVRPQREVKCFNCSHPYHASFEAQSSQCPKCSSYVSLVDYQITEPWNRRIQTCGDVIIRKTGSVSGATLQCHNLTVLGELAGSVECSGNLIIRSHGKIIGKVNCRNLRVEKGAKVEFLNAVQAVTAFIDGNVRGQISCTGAITLEKRAHLQGLVRTSSLIVKEGAKHSGTIEVVQAAPL